MVYLNENISFNISLLKKNLCHELENFIEDQLDYYLDKEKIKKIKNNMKKKINYLLNNDYFIYKTMNKTLCTFKHERGKNAGYFCCKKNNLNNPKQVYLCVKHDKNHIPKKKKNEKKDENTFELLTPSEIKNSNYRNNKKSIPISKSLKLINLNNAFNESFNNKSKFNNIDKIYNKIIFIEKNKKLYINYLDINLFKNMIKNYNNKLYYNIKHNDLNDIKYYYFQKLLHQYPFLSDCILYF